MKLPGLLGLGKLESIRNGKAEVSLFYSPSHRETKTYLTTSIKRDFLGPETRAYVLTDGLLKIGRVKDYLTRDRDDGLIVYQLQFTNGRYADVPECDLEVRCWTAPPDPALVLAAGSIPSQFFHDRRQAASERLVATQAAAQGMTALLSSSIEFVPHQIAAVRRILSDPLQRYLLADEVGMGKTIEAGVIIRQCLIDDPTRSILVLVPASLVGQWRDELDSKFRSADFPGAVQVLPHLSAASASVPDLLVIDEAHQVIADEYIRTLACATSRVLLLSATPVLGEETTFLSLLNLLDPHVNPLDDLESFRKKVAERQEFGRLLLGLQPDSPTYVLNVRLAEAMKRFEGDAVVAELVAQARLALTAADSRAVEGACRALQLHVADTYRIHQRVIRARRSDATGSDFQSRSPSGPGDRRGQRQVTIEIDEDERFADVAAALEDWREHSLHAVCECPVEERLRVARRFVEVLNAGARSIDALRRASARRG